MSNELQTKSAAEITIGSNGALTPRNFEGLYRLATIMAASGLMPKGMDRPESVFVAVQMGLEVGLSPMQAVQNIASINGRPTIWGDAMIGLVRGSGQMEAIKEDLVGEGEATEAVCTVWRKGEDHPSVGRFSVADAKRAQLWGKQGPWSQYPRRMLQMRARGFALRDKFADILKGLYAREELEGVEEHYMGSAAVVESGYVDTAIEALVSRRSAAPETLERIKGHVSQNEGDGWRRVPPEPPAVVPEEHSPEPEPPHAPADGSQHHDEPPASNRWPRRMNDGTWVDAANEEFDRELHGWNAAEKRPAVTTDGVFRAKRGTRGAPAKDEPKRQQEPPPFDLEPKDPEPADDDDVQADYQEHSVSEETRQLAAERATSRVQEATIRGLAWQIDNAQNVAALTKRDEAVRAAAIPEDAKAELLARIEVRVAEMMESGRVK